MVVEKIKVGRKFIDYNDKDPIFKLTAPTEPKKDDENCVFCARNMSEIDKYYCQFCGHCACLRCCHKKRNFQPKPGQTEVAQGLSCRVCDRKFIHKNLKSTEMEHVVYLKQWDLDE